MVAFGWRLECCWWQVDLLKTFHEDGDLFVSWFSSGRNCTDQCIFHQTGFLFSNKTGFKMDELFEFHQLIRLKEEEILLLSASNLLENSPSAAEQVLLDLEQIRISCTRKCIPRDIGRHTSGVVSKLEEEILLIRGKVQRLANTKFLATRLLPSHL